MSDALELWTEDELCNHAFSIFEELAEENLSAADFALYNQHCENDAWVDLALPADGWVDLIQQELDPALHLEAHIGLTLATGELVLARILLSREKHDTLCHAQWRIHA